MQHTNQLLVALIQKLCKSKQNQHLISNFNPDKATSDSLPEFTLFLMRNSKQSKSLTSNLINDENYFPGQMIKKRNKTQRSNTIETSQVIDLFDSSFKLKKAANSKNESFLSRNMFNSFNQNKLTTMPPHTQPAPSPAATTLVTIQNSFGPKADSSIRRYIFHRIVGAPNNFFNQKPDDIELNEDNDCKSIVNNKQRFKYK